ncbi:MAG: hypothetical protein DRO11_09365 [Methanobacteriota archaeon]|nr:MAG: hypothetical protein DRO11_09365 [Euryarchaeota archaeon]
MKIEEFPGPADQMCNLGKHHWSISRLFELSKDFEVMEVPLDHINLYSTYEKLTLRNMVMHMKAIDRADLSFPIILDEDGELMDGRHRLMKALYTGQKAIRVVRFDRNPPPCKVDD